MTTRINFLGVSGYEVEGPGSRILMDPFLDGNPLAPCTPDEVATPDVIVVSHAAFDHMGDAAAIAKRTGAPVVCGNDVRLKLIDDGVDAEQVTATVWGICVEVDGIRIRPVECHHWSMTQLSDGQWVTGTPMAFIVETEPGVSIYHFGDSCIFDMTLIGQLYRPTVGLLGVTIPTELMHRVPGRHKPVTGEMDPDEAARVAQMLGVRVAVASHYLASNPDVEAFAECVAAHDSTGTRQAFAPAVGETLLVDADGAALEGRS